MWEGDWFECVSEQHARVIFGDFIDDDNYQLSRWSYLREKREGLRIYSLRASVQRQPPIMWALLLRPALQNLTTAVGHDDLAGGWADADDLTVNYSTPPNPALEFSTSNTSWSCQCWSTVGHRLCFQVPPLSGKGCTRASTSQLDTYPNPFSW